MRISYPEAERMGWNYEDVYLFAFSELDYLTTELQKLYNNDGINDIPSYVLRLVKKMLETWESYSLFIHITVIMYQLVPYVEILLII